MRTSPRALFVIVFLDLLGFGVVLPALALSAKEHGASGIVLGLVFASFSLMQLLSLPLWGRLADRIGRRPVLLAALLGNALGFVVFALAGSLAALFASRMLCGLAAASVSTAQAYVADTTDEERRAKGMALISTAFGLALVLGPPLGGSFASLGQELGLGLNRLPGALAAALSAAALAVVAFALPESRGPAGAARDGTAAAARPSWSTLFRSRGLRLTGVSLATLMFTLSSLVPLLVLVGKDRYALSGREVGYLFGLMGVVVLALQVWVIERLARRLGDVGTSVAGAGALFVGLLLMPLTRDRLVLIAATCLLGAGQGLCYPALSAHLSKLAPREQLGGVMGVSSALNACARIFGPPVAGLAYDAFAASGAAASQAAVVAIAIAIASPLLTRGRLAA